jgi:hypothetical protein
MAHPQDALIRISTRRISKAVISLAVVDKGTHRKCYARYSGCIMPDWPMAKPATTPDWTNIRYTCDNCDEEIWMFTRFIQIMTPT